MQPYTDETSVPATPSTQGEPDVAERVRQIRARLPGQVLRERLETARALYGDLFARAELENKVAHTLPSRLGFRRTTVLEPIETYREMIPDEALLKYDDALRSGLFASYIVATPAYHAERQVDPWIVGEVRDAGVFAVIAQWR
jgi:hypothetical protein